MQTATYFTLSEAGKRATGDKTITASSRLSLAPGIAPADIAIRFLAWAILINSNRRQGRQRVVITLVVEEQDTPNFIDFSLHFI